MKDKKTEEIDYSYEMEKTLNSFYSNKDVQEIFAEIKKQIITKDKDGLEFSILKLKWMKDNFQETAMMSGVIGTLLAGAVVLCKHITIPLENYIYYPLATALIAICGAVTAQNICLAQELSNANRELTYSLKL